VVEVAYASINNFVPVAEQANVQPEEPIFVLTGSQLEKIVTRAVQEATKSLISKVEALDEKIDQGYGNLALEIALDRKRITRLEQIEPQPLQRDRGEILRALLVANGGKMLAKEARQKMHLSRSRFSELMATMGDHIDTKPYHLNKSAKILILK
jgi:hypothetical protein